MIVADAVHHLPAKDRVLTEIERVLAPGGVVVVQECDPTTIRGRLVVAAEQLVGFDSEFDAPSTLCRWMECTGLTATGVDDGFSYVVPGVAR